MAGRSIRVFLIDGSASGLRTAEIGLSTIQALVVPRASLAAAKKREEVQRTGTYILVGNDSEKPGTSKVYIGEADVVLTRLTTHDKEPDKDFWEDAVVLVSKDKNPNKAHCRYLEARLIALVRQAKRCTVTNKGNPPEEGKLAEAEEVEMADALSQFQLLLRTLGYDLFSPVQEARTRDVKAAGVPEFCYQGNGFAAGCQLDSSSGQFVVLKDSTARKHETLAVQRS